MAEADPLLLQLIVSFQSTAMIQMGKIINPMSGKVERELDAARQTIDLLQMIQRKTVGNLAETERRFLEHVLYELRMNYVEEGDREPDRSTRSEDEPAQTGDSEGSAENRTG